MIDSIPVLVWCCRPDGTTEFLNQRWLDYTGLSSEHALDLGWKVPVHPDDLPKLMDTKRLEEGTYAMPFSESGEVRQEITAQELGALLSGIDLRQAKRRKRYRRTTSAAA
jgi:PAS domain-containing protein